MLLLIIIRHGLLGAPHYIKMVSTTRLSTVQIYRQHSPRPRSFLYHKWSYPCVPVLPSLRIVCVEYSCEMKIMPNFTVLALVVACELSVLITLDPS